MHPCDTPASVRSSVLFRTDDNRYALCAYAKDLVPPGLSIPERKRGTGVGSDAVCAGIITAAELRHGRARKASAALNAQIEAVPESMQVLALEHPAAVRYGEIRAGPEAAGAPIGPSDLLIAAQASATGAALVTANSREFARVPDVPVRNGLEQESDTCSVDALP